MRGRYRAIAVIEGGENAPLLEGTVIFTETHFGVHVEAQVSGLPVNETGFYGFHLHEGESCTLPDFESAGGHYNPEGLPHPLHAGDFPMLIVTDAKEAWLTFMTTRFEVKDIIGKTVIIHMTKDDYTTQPSGGVHGRIGCGVIEPF